MPWIVCPSRESRLDKYDSYGSSVANERPRLASIFAKCCKLKCNDPFGTEWHNNHGTLCLRSQVWGRGEEDHERGGYRLFCRRNVLKKILATYNQHLLVLIKLERAEKKYQRESRYTHSVAVASITESLDVNYFKGRVNHLNKFF